MEDIKLVFDERGNICNDNFPDLSGFAGLPQDEIDEKIKEDQLNTLRQRRDMRIAETDWTQLPDVPQATKDKYKDYRQSLRDITNTYKNLNEVVWPELP
tara:strand:- start:53 stop:349 length:297 start_codon:yes stop_codon:yes gene_type:complete